MDGRDGTDALKSRWVTSYNIHEPLDRGKTDAKQVRDTHQTGAQTMMFNKRALRSGDGVRHGIPSPFRVPNSSFLHGKA
jgi:hypothetical protein